MHTSKSIASRIQSQMTYHKYFLTQFKSLYCKDYTIEGCIARGIAVHKIFLQTSTEYPKTEVDFKVGTRPDMMDGFCPTRIPKSRALLLLLMDYSFKQQLMSNTKKVSAFLPPCLPRGQYFSLQMLIDFLAFLALTMFSASALVQYYYASTTLIIQLTHPNCLWASYCRANLA